MKIRNNKEATHYTGVTYKYFEIQNTTRNRS